MGMESFNNLTGKQEKHTILYDGEVVCVEEFNADSKDRPSSVKLQEAHPELYDYLMRKDGAKQFNVGIMHIDSRGSISAKLAKDKLSKYDKGILESEIKQKEILKKIFTELQEKLIKDTRSDFEDIARQIKEDPNGELSKIDYFTAYSPLANKKEIAKELGIEIFEIDDGDDKKWDSANNKQRNKVRDAISKYIPIKYTGSPPQIALMSRQAVLNLLKEDGSSNSDDKSL